jgi:RsiW-degrading membrane proteinase PrsW (M82 family)
MIVPKTREGQGHPEVRQKVNNSNRIFLRMPSSYIPFFQAMAEDYYQRGKIKAPSISLLAKTCLITAGNAWNRMMIQLINKEFEGTRQQQMQIFGESK